MIKSFFSLKRKSPSAKCQRAGNVMATRQNDFRTFYLIDETEKVYRNIEEIVNI